MNQKRLNRKDGSFWTLSPERCARGFSFCADWSAYKHPARLSTGKWVVSFGWESHKGSGSVRLRIGRRFFSGGCGKIRVAQKGQSPLSAWDFGCRTSRSYFVLHFSQPAGASFGWAWHRQRFFCGSLRRDMHRMRVLRALVAIIGTIWRESREMRARGWVLHRKRAHLEHISPSTAEMTRIRRASCHIAVDFPTKGKKHAHCASILPARNAGKWDLSLFSRQAPSTELPLISRIQEMRGSSVLGAFLFAGKLYLGK